MRRQPSWPTRVLFSQSKGEIPQLSLKMTGAELTEEQTKLHEELLRLRNKVFAHSDEGHDAHGRESLSRSAR